MKKTTFNFKQVMFIFCLTPSILFSQNTWNSSTISTITNGQTSIGQLTPQIGYRLTSVNVNNTIYNGFHNSTTNSFNGTQIGLNNSLVNSSGSGVKYALFNVLTVSGNGNKYGIYSSVNGNSTGNNYSGYFVNNSTAGLNYGIYASVTGNESRSGYFRGGNMEVHGGGIIMTGSNNTSKFLIHSPWQANEGFISFIPNSTNGQEDWNFSAALTLNRDGSMKKTIPSLNSNLKAFTIGDFNNNDIFRIYGDGKVFATEINVRISSNFPDYVFKPDYILMPLTELREFINQNGHLPNIPSAEQVNEEGINLSEMNVKVIEKIEELTLYILKQQEEIIYLKSQIIK